MPDLCWRMPGDIRRLLGAVAWTHLVHAVHCQRSWLLAAAGRLDLDPAVGLWRRRRAAVGLDFAGADDAWHVDALFARRAWRRPARGRRFGLAADPARRQRRS